MLVASLKTAIPVTGRVVYDNAHTHGSNQIVLTCRLIRTGHAYTLTNIRYEFNKQNVTNNGNTLSNRCLERSLDGTAELVHLPSPGSS